MPYITHIIIIRKTWERHYNVSNFSWIIYGTGYHFETGIGKNTDKIILSNYIDLKISFKTSFWFFVAKTIIVLERLENK